MSTSLSLPVEQFKTPMEALTQASHELMVCDQKSLELAATLLNQIADCRKDIHAACKPTIEAAHKVHKNLTTMFGQLERPFIAMDVAIRAKITEYTTEQKRIQLRAQAAAEAKARADREAALLDAAMAESEGQTEVAEVIREQAEQTVAAPPPPMPKAAGLSMREEWFAEVPAENMQTFLVAVLEGKIPIALIQIDAAFLKAQVRIQKSLLEQTWPGVKTRMEMIPVRR